MILLIHITITNNINSTYSYMNIVLPLLLCSPSDKICAAWASALSITHIDVFPTQRKDWCIEYSSQDWGGGEALSLAAHPLLYANRSNLLISRDVILAVIESIPLALGYIHYTGQVSYNSRHDTADLWFAHLPNSFVLIAESISMYVCAHTCSRLALRSWSRNVIGSTTLYNEVSGIENWVLCHDINTINISSIVERTTVHSSTPRNGESRIFTSMYHTRYDSFVVSTFARQTFLRKPIFTYSLYIQSTDIMIEHTLFHRKKEPTSIICRAQDRASVICSLYWVFRMYIAGTPEDMPPYRVRWHDTQENTPPTPPVGWFSALSRFSPEQGGHTGWKCGTCT